MSVALYLLIRLLPPVAVALAAVCVLPFLALLCLQKSLAEIEADATAPLTRPALRRAVGDLWRPVALAAVCVLPFLALLCLQKSLAEIEADATAPLTRPALRRAVGDLWRPRSASASSVFRGSSSPASSRPKAPAAPRCSSDSRRRPFWWWPSSCFWHRAGPKLRRRRGARRIRDGGPFGGGPRAVSFEGLRHPAYLPGALPRAHRRVPAAVAVRAAVHDAARGVSHVRLRGGEPAAHHHLRGVYHPKRTRCSWRFSCSASRW